MVIRAQCGCGWVVEAPEEHQGAPVRCPACGRLVRLQDTGIVKDDVQAGPGMTCARCGRRVAAALVVCPHCLGNPHTGAPPRTDVGPVRTQEVREEGFLRLCLDMLIHPARTADGLTYHLARREMFIKSAVLYVSGLFGLGAVGLATGEEAGVVVWTLLEVTGGLALAALAVFLFGHLFVGGGSFRETFAAFVFVWGLAMCVGLVVGLAATPVRGELEAELRLCAVLIAVGFFVWRMLLQLLVTGAIFDCGLTGALTINSVAVLEAVLTYFVVLSMWQP